MGSLYSDIPSWLHRVPAGLKLALLVLLGLVLFWVKDPLILGIIAGLALALWLTKYYINEFGFSIQLAAFLAACFSLPGGVLRAIGGWISDRAGAYRTTWYVLWIMWICFFFLSYPQTDFTISTVNGPLNFHIGHSPWVFTFLLFLMGIATAIGKASVFKFISDDFTDNIGAVSGVVGLAGGLGGFLLPVLFGIALDLTGIRSSCFMLLFGTVSVSLIWMHFSRYSDVQHPREEAADGAQLAGKAAAQ